MTTVRLKTRVCEQRPSWARSPVRVGRKGRAPAATPAPESLASMVQARRASSPVRIRPPTRRYMYEDHAAADGRLTARSRGAQSSSRRSVSPTSSVSAVSVSRPPSRSLVQAVPTRSPPASVATTVLRPSILGSSSPRLGAQPRLLCKPPGATSLISLRASQVMRRQWQWQRRHRRGLRARRGEAAAWGRCPHPAGRQTPHHRRGALHSLIPHAPLQRSEWARGFVGRARGANPPKGLASPQARRNSAASATSRGSSISYARSAAASGAAGGGDAPWRRR